MKRTVVVAAMALALISAQARADEHRPGDAALGALSGAVVFGPIGAVAGAVVGYTAGPSIAHSWGFRHARSASRRTKTARQAAPAPEARASTAQPAAAPAPKDTPKTASTTPPPVQTLE